MAKTRSQKVSDVIKGLLKEKADDKLLQKVCPEIAGDYAGLNPPTIAELLGQKIIVMALDHAKPNEWAVNMVLDRAEGKAVQGDKPNAADEIIEDKLTRASTQHINHISAAVISSIDIGADDAEDVSDRPSATDDVDVS